MSTPEKENKTMNPQIVEDFSVGTRDLRQLTIYPLSMGDQMELEALITKVIIEWSKTATKSDDTVAFVTYFLDVIKDNIVKLLSLVTDEKEEELKVIGKSFSNFQATELAKMIFETNYLDPYEKNLKSLPLMDKLFQLGRQAPSLLEDIPNIDLKTSTENITKTEVSQQDNLNSSSKKLTRTIREK